MRVQELAGVSQRKLTCVPLLPQVGTLSNSILHVDAGLGEWAAMLDGYSEEVWLLAMKLGWGGGGGFPCSFCMLLSREARRR